MNTAGSIGNANQMTLSFEDQNKPFTIQSFDNHRNTVIGDALNRKVVNDSYHSKAYPLFM